MPVLESLAAAMSAAGKNFAAKPYDPGAHSFKPGNKVHNGAGVVGTVHSLLPHGIVRVATKGGAKMTFHHTNLHHGHPTPDPEHHGRGGTDLNSGGFSTGELFCAKCGTGKACTCGRELKAFAATPKKPTPHAQYKRAANSAEVESRRLLKNTKPVDHYHADDIHRGHHAAAMYHQTAARLSETPEQKQRHKLMVEYHRKQKKTYAGLRDRMKAM